MSWGPFIAKTLAVYAIKSLENRQRNRKTFEDIERPPSKEEIVLILDSMRQERGYEPKWLFHLCEEEGLLEEYNKLINQGMLSIPSQVINTEEICIEYENKECQVCAEKIKLKAKKCKHCGEWIDDETLKQQILERKQQIMLLCQERNKPTTNSSFIKSSDTWTCICGTKNDAATSNCTSCSKYKTEKRSSW